MKTEEKKKEEIEKTECKDGLSSYCPVCIANGAAVEGSDKLNIYDI